MARPIQNHGVTATEVGLRSVVQLQPNLTGHNESKVDSVCCMHPRVLGFHYFSKSGKLLTDLGDCGAHVRMFWHRFRVRSQLDQPEAKPANRRNVVRSGWNLA